MMSNHHIKTLFMALILAIGLLIPFQPPAAAVSLWNDQGGMFSDRKARTVGDNLMIIISETSSATRSANASNSKSGSTQVNKGGGLLSFIDPADATGNDNFDSKGKITNTNAVSGRITVQVTAVKPNGNMLISGSQVIKQNGEEQRMVFTGEVRPEDVGIDNTVMSYAVANAQLRIEGKGSLASKQRPGIVSQLFNFLF